MVDKSNEAKLQNAIQRIEQVKELLANATEDQNEFINSKLKESGFSINKVMSEFNIFPSLVDSLRNANKHH